MPESPDLFAEIASLRDEVEEQGGVLDALLRSSAREIRAEILGLLDSDRVLGEILVRVDGVKTQGEIGEEIRDAGGVGASPMTISRRFDALANDLNLIVLVDRRKEGKVYRKTRVDAVLGISREWSKKRTG